MAKYVIDESTLKGIGDAIRAKKGTSDPIPVPSLASEISSIEAGGSDPTYNGYIPLGKYVLATDEVIEELYLEPEPYVSDDTSWFKCSVGSLSVYNFINARPDSGSIVAGWYADGTEVSLSVGDTIEVIEQAEVDEDTFDLFMNYFTFVGATEPDTPTYNGVIPLGNYVYHANPVATLTCEIIEDEEGNPYPYWFETIDETDEVRQGFGIYITPDTTEIEASYEDYLNFYPCDNSPFKVFKEIEVTEEQYNAFMQYFTPVEAIDKYVIPTGTRYYYWGEGSYNDFSIEEEEPFFVYNGNNGVGIRNYESNSDVGVTTELILEDGSVLADVAVQYTIEITREVEVTEEQLREFNNTFYIEPL